MTQLNMFNKALSPLQASQVERITTLLTNMGCTYAIVLPDGVTLSNTENLRIKAVKARRKRPLKYPFGTWTNYIKPFLLELKEGEVALIPYDKFGSEELHRNVCAIASDMWGTKSYVSALRKEGVEIMRGNV